jgi:hypothetical protein
VSVEVWVEVSVEVWVEVSVEVWVEVSVEVWVEVSVEEQAGGPTMPRDKVCGAHSPLSPQHLTT